MALTTGSNIFRADRETTRFVAECASLRHLITSVRIIGPHNGYPDWYGGANPHDLWEDGATGGGGCRLVWRGDVVWISRHSGYPQANITGDVAQIFRELGCDELDAGIWQKNPHIYGG